jgi:uncharacterized membrane protein
MSNVPPPPPNPFEPEKTSPAPGTPRPLATDPTLPVADPADVEQNKVMAILAYFIFFLPLLAAPKSRFARYHGNQALLLVIAWVANLVIFGCGGSLLTAVTRGYAAFCCFPLAGLIGLAVLVLLILGIVNAANGVMKPLPLIGQFTLIKWDVPQA